MGEWVKRLIEQQKRKKMTVVVWSKYHCPYCDKAKALLDNKGIKFEERKIGDGYTKEDLLESVPDARTVPQIIINGSAIGGYDQLMKYIEETGFNGTGHTL
jgi:glutaredoxin 3